MRLLLVRHAPCRANEERRYAGRGTDAPVSRAGREALGNAGSFDEVGLVFTSTLLRARESARALFPRARIVRVAGLDECDFGAFEGKGADELASDARWQAWVDAGCVTRCPGGESRAAFTARVADAMASLIRRELAAGAPHLICVCHAGTIMATLATFATAPVAADGFFSWGVGHLGTYLADVELEASRIRLVHPTRLDSLPEALSRLGA